MSSARRGGRVVLVGWGTIGTAVARQLAADRSCNRIVAVAVRNPDQARGDLPEGAGLITDPADLAGLDADLVVEAAGRDSVPPWGRAALGAGIDLALSSISALTDSELLDELRGLARTSGAKLIICPRVLGGVDALASARRMGLKTVEHRIIMPALAWAGTEAEGLCALDRTEGPTAFSTGMAGEAAARFPQNANVALTTALAGMGPERTRVTLIIDPAITQNCHEITASGDFGALDMRIANNPLPGNPKSSAMAALSLARPIENRTAALVV